MPPSVWFLWLCFRLVGNTPGLACDPTPCRYGDVKTVEVYNPTAGPVYGYIDLEMYIARDRQPGPFWGPIDPDIRSTSSNYSRTWLPLPAHSRQLLRYRTADLNPFYKGHGPYFRFSLHYATAKRNGQQRVEHSQPFRID